MRSGRNWGVIDSGAKFEALVTAIIRSKDRKASLFGRRGKDAGQDARSGDRSIVFQAKYHQDRSSAKAINDAIKEATKILEYRKPEDPRSKLWEGVTYWRLVTNADFNPNDEQKWNTEVVPLFSKQGLRADYWQCRDLDVFLDNYPQIDRHFFQNETRVLLTLPEKREHLLFEEPFLQRENLGNFFGRENYLRDIDNFLLSEKLFLVVHGSGGVGKTRLLLEAGEIASGNSWQVLWANVESMSSTGTWFDAIVPERPTLLIVDEPDDDKLLRMLSEQLGGYIGRTTQWKVAVTVRSPKDPVLRFLRGPKIQLRVQELAIDPLSLDMAEAMCKDLLKSGPLREQRDVWLQGASRQLAKLWQHPMWLTLAIHLLEKEGDLSKVPVTAQGLADSYIEEIINLQSQVPGKNVLALLNWIALIGTVNKEDNTFIKLLSEKSRIGDEITVQGIMDSLIERRALIERGARKRLIEVKPDVVRDRLLIRWLSLNLKHFEPQIQPSDDAKELVDGLRDSIVIGSLSTYERAILKSLARTEFVLKLSKQPIELLDSLFTGILEALHQISPSRRISIVEILVDVAFFRPIDVVNLSKAFRSSPVQNETIQEIFRSREVGQHDVVLELAWLLYHAALGVQREDEQEEILTELCAVADDEFEIQQGRNRKIFPKDGKRAADLIKQIVIGGPQFWSNFEKAAKRLADQFLDEIDVNQPNHSFEVVDSLLDPFLALQRHQSWSEEPYKIAFRNYFITPEHPAWKMRDSLLKRIKNLLSKTDIPLETRISLWELISKAHASANYSYGNGPESIQKIVREELLNDLIWAYSILSNRKIELREIKTARELWNWHSRFEKDPELKAASTNLELIYKQNDLANEFEPLFSWDSQEQQNARIADTAKKLATAKTKEEISSFIDRAVRFFGGDEQKVFHIIGVAYQLGEYAETCEIVRAFVTESLSKPQVPIEKTFAIVTAYSWINTLRSKNDNPEAAFKIVVELYNLCDSNDLRIEFIERLYGRVLKPSYFGKMISDECEHLRSLGQMFIENGREDTFLRCVGWTLHYNWPNLRVIIEQTLNTIDRNRLGKAIGALIEAIYWVVHDSDPNTIPRDLVTWLLDQICRMPDMDELGYEADWHLDEIINKVGKAPILWLTSALSKRREMEAEDDHKEVRVLGIHLRLSRYVYRVTAESSKQPEIRNTISSLIDLVSDKGIIGYEIPRILRDVDPEGLLVPDEVVHRLQHTTTKEDIWLLARIAGVYPINGPAWRKIAKPVVKQSASFQMTAERGSLFNALKDHGPQTWSGIPGEVPGIFLAEVESAKRMKEEEVDGDLRPFWEWNLELAEAELKREEENVKEERGE